MLAMFCWAVQPLLLAHELPSWSGEDCARLKKGELVAGVGILVGHPAAPVPEPLPEVAPEPEVPPLEPAVPEPEYDPRGLPKEYLLDYFVTLPETYLVDPQRLMSKQEAMDREGFLEYHAEDSVIDIRLYLFDAQQQIPAPYSIGKLVRERYAGEPLTAVVFCFMGDPSRNQIAFGGKGASSVSAAEAARMLESAREKAMEKSDPAAQVESFIVQLSIRLYWLEKELAKAVAEAGVPGAGATEAEPASSAASSNEPGKQAAGESSAWRPYLVYLLGGLAGVVSGIAGLLLGWRLWSSGRSYRFPVLEIPVRLGADYAAGVGAAMSFHDKLGSPTAQRDQVPDYLRRM